MTCRFLTGTLSAAFLVAMSGCASTARLADDERQIADLQWHVIQIESSLDDDDTDDDVTAAKVVSTTRPSHETARDTLARLDARRAAHLTNLAKADAPAFRARQIVADGGGIATTLCMTPGPIRNTGRQLDVAIRGEGFFCVKAAIGVAYTRLGNLFINNDGTLVLGGKAGVPVEPRLTLPPGTVDVTIAADGAVSAFVKNTTHPIVIGRLQLARFADASRLSAVDDATFVETPGSGPAILGSPGDAGFGRVQQEFLEGSNVLADGERAALHDVKLRRDHLLRLVSSK